MININVNVQGDRRILLNRLQNLKPAFKNIGEHLTRTTDRRFAQEGGALDWKPLKPETIAEKRRNRRRMKILQRSGPLRNTITYFVTERGLVFGSNQVYAPTHQFGDEDRGIPARPFLVITDEDRTAIAEIIDNHLFNI
jgi:phage virion morphogenesis protein